MAPRSGDLHSGITSTPIPPSDDKPFISVFEWLKRKRERDGAEGLWRVHDKLYDFTKYMKNHPGGKYWLETTKGTDITEAFESIHIRDQAEKLLPKFYVRQARAPRYSLITFHDSGFFRTLKRKIRERKLLDKTSLGPQNKTKLLADSLAFMVFAMGLLGTIYNNYGLLIISGLFLNMLAVCAHNFFHMKDNWRMYYFNLSLMSLREWRISHVLSHHNYPNTNLDLEIKMVEPFWNFLPREKKLGSLSWIFTPILLAVLCHAQFLQRLLRLLVKQQKLHLDELIQYSLLVFLIAFSNQNILTCFLCWNIIIVSGSFFFGLVGFTAAHHHPDIYHDGDFLGNNKDFGVLQLAAVRSREEVDGNFFLVLITFGDHALHHLFPAVDHSKLPLLNHVFEETCKEFKLNFKPVKSSNLVIGMFQQLKRSYVNKKLNILQY